MSWLTKAFDKLKTNKRKPKSPKDFFIANIVEVQRNRWQIELNGTLIDFPAVSWQMARGSGASFKTALRRVKPEVFAFLDVITEEAPLKRLVISSLWRPPLGGASPHNHGNGIDIGTVEYLGFDEVFIYRSGLNHAEPKIIREFSNLCWNTGLLWQYIGPWRLKGNRISNRWKLNRLSSSLENTHADHIHLTIGCR